jgi:hypothetical protein
MPKHYFLVYDDHTHQDSLACLLESVRRYGPEFEIIVFDSRDIDPAFREQHRDILDLPRGGGYWLWKSYIIDRTLVRLDHGDILMYLDSKYYFKCPFQEMYQHFLKDQDFLAWTNRPNGNVHAMHQWCKMDVVIRFHMEERVFVQGVCDCWAGFLTMRKTDRVCHMMHDWLEMCCDAHNITDSPSQVPNSPYFCEHRHDQSLLSIVLYKNNVPLHFQGTTYLQDVRNPC